MRSVARVLEEDYFLTEDQSDEIIQTYYDPAKHFGSEIDLAETLYELADQDGYFREEDCAI